jgi:hypothetical protein
MIMLLLIFLWYFSNQRMNAQSKSRIFHFYANKVISNKKNVQREIGRSTWRKEFRCQENNLYLYVINEKKLKAGYLDTDIWILPNHYSRSDKESAISLYCWNCKSNQTVYLMILFIYHSWNKLKIDNEKDD